MKIRAASWLPLLALGMSTMTGTGWIGSGGTGQASDLATLAGPRQASPTTSSKTPASSFAEAVTAFASQNRIAIVAEGAPQTPVLTGSDTAANVTADDSLDAKVERFARTYDYRSKPLKGSPNVYVLQKRYSNPDDLPGVTLEECAAASDDVVRVIAVYSPKKDPRQAALKNPFTAYTVDLVTALSEEQLQDLQKGTLRVAALDSNQRAVVQRTALYLYLTVPSSDAGASAESLKQALSGGALSRENSIKALAVQGSGPDGRAWLLPLPLGPSGLEQASFSASEANAPRDSAPELKVKTLEEAVAALQAVPGSPPLSVDPILASKPVTVAGTERVSAGVVMAALAEVYGLRVLQTKEGQQRLARRALRLPRTFTEVPQAVRLCLPQPLLAAMHDASSWAGSQAPTASAAPVAPPMVRFVPPASSGSAIDVLGGKATYRVHRVVDPKLSKASPGKGVPVVDLDSQTRSNLAVALMTNLLRILRNPLKPQGVDYITRFDDLYLKGGPSRDMKGQEMVSVFLEVRDPVTNQLRNSVGVSSMVQPSQN